jgi:hypothetical protein
MKHSQLRQIIKEEISKVLSEVGEATSEPYIWKKASTKEDVVFFTFTTDQGSIYKVALDNYIYEDFYDNNKEYPAIEVSFGIKEKSQFSTTTVTNKGEMYRVMSTVVDIVKDYLNRNKNIKAIIYQPTKKEDNIDNKRNNLYMAFIKKQIPGATFEDSYGSIIVKIP